MWVRESISAGHDASGRAVGAAMIEMRWRDKRYCPVITCDICGLQIEDATMGAVATERADDKSPSSTVRHLYVHKGRCHESADRALETPAGLPGWTELTHHLIYLSAGCGMSAACLLNAIQAAKDLNELG